MNTDAEVITFPDATAEVLTYLRGQLATFGDTAAVDRKVPKPRPSRLVKVAVNGGQRLDLVRYRTLVTVECWDVRDDLAHDLAAVCYGLLFAMPFRHNGAEVYRVDEAAGLVPLPDPDTDSPRFTFGVSVDLRGTPLEV
jgi:hypothetical protein